MRLLLIEIYVHELFSIKLCNDFFRIFNHPNILPVLGTCNQPPHLVVISQFMSFGSLYDVIHGESGEYLSWTYIYGGKVRH